MTLDRDAAKANVRRFYETFGWQRRDDGRFNDGVLADDWRPVMRWYRRACNRRLAKLLVARGHLLLDAASGPVQLDDYRDLSAGYDFHVCVDFSSRALQEARARLGDRALCVQADVTALPFRDGAFDAVVSLHTIYHLPPDDQGDALAELHRTLGRGRSGVVVYAQDRPPGHPLPERWVSWLLRRARFARRLAPPEALDPPGLYFCPLPLDQVRGLLDDGRIAYTLRVWRSVSVPFTRLFVPDNPLGALLLRAIYLLEALLPGWSGRHGYYPVFRLTKR